jgi:D-amino-acid dehydrogenase
MAEGPSCIVVGAGVAGLSAALHLARAGAAVSVIDPYPPPGGASYGNAGMISPDTAIPIALPGMLHKVPGWLTDPLGPLAVRPSYLPRALPWLLRWIRAGRMDRVEQISDALRSLHAGAFARWEEMLGQRAYRELFRPVGLVQAWDSPQETPAAALERRLRDRHGIRTEVLSADDMRQMFPGIDRKVQRGLMIPGNGFTISPRRAVETLAELAREAGAVFHRQKVLKLIAGDGGWTAMTNVGSHKAAHVVVAGGAWSRALLDPLGVSVPLETERGYHAMIANPGIDLRMTIIHKDRSFGMTPMEDGIRVAGTVEIAGLDAPPNEQRAERLAELAGGLFPGLQGDPPRLWMGFRPSMPDSLPVVGPVPSRPGLHLCFGHGHFGMTGGPPSGRIVARSIMGQGVEIDPAPFSVTRFN